MVLQCLLFHFCFPVQICMPKALFFFFFDRFSLSDPIHIIAEQTREDSSCQILCSPRRIRETQGRIWGNFSIESIPYGLFLIFCFFLFSQVHRLVVNRDAKFTNFVEVCGFHFEFILLWFWCCVTRLWLILKSIGFIKLRNFPQLGQ